MKQLTELHKAFGSTPPEVHCAIERAFAKGEVQMKKRHKLMMVLPIAACLIAAIAVALAAGNHASPQPDVLAAPVLENTESPQPEKCVYFTDEGFTGFEENCYHAVQNCGGMIGARAGTVDEAVELGKFPCPVCLADEIVPADAEVPTVWCTKNGRYYHTEQFCSGMHNAQSETQTQAEADGKQPCPACVNAAPTVWCTKNGQYYHTDQFCSHMHNAQSTTPEQAISEGKQPCPVCVAAETESEVEYNNETLSN